MAHSTSERMNGTLPRKAKAKAPRKAKARPAARRLGYAVGCVACVVLALSVGHCADALELLTGSGMVASFMLAVGIDCGLVACEIAALWAGAQAAAACHRVVVGSIALSVALNAYAGWTHGGVVGCIISAAIPAVVYALGQAAGKLVAGK